MKICLFLVIIYSFEIVSSPYNVRKIVRKLHQQFCSIVEVGEGFCSMFVEFRSNLQSPLAEGDNVAEVFLGLCPCNAMSLWQFCSKELHKARSNDCKLDLPAIYNSSARVHRRLCDLTAMQLWNVQCNCSHEFGGQLLYPVIGFNTCFRSSLPESICKPGNVCGIAKCRTKTLFGAHLVQCDPNCKGKQPFCENKKSETTRYRTVNSVWSPWTKMTCNKSASLLQSESVCVNSLTKTPAFDCLGPGLFCCPQNYPDCTCDVVILDNLMKVQRSLGPCTERQYFSSDSLFKKYYRDMFDYYANNTEYELKNYLINGFNKNYRSIRNINPNVIGRNHSVDIVNVKLDTKHQQKRDDIYSNDYSSYWNPTTPYVIIPKEKRLESSVKQKQNNWDELEQKDEDPWKSGLLLDKEDMTYYRQFTNENITNKTPGNQHINITNHFANHNKTSSNFGRNISAIINSVLSGIYKNQLSESNSYRNPMRKSKNITMNVNGSIKNDSLVSIDTMAFMRDYVNKNMYSQAPINSDADKYNYFGFKHSKSNIIPEDYYRNKEHLMTTTTQTSLKYLKAKNLGMQIIELDLNKLNDNYKNKITNRLKDDVNYKKDNLKEIQNDDNFSSNCYSQSTNSFILPIYLETINISTNSVNNTSAVNKNY